MTSNNPFIQPPETEWNLLSLGAGVQSSTLALMAAHGELTPMPNAAIFADTGSEPASVYEWLEYLESKLPFPVHRVQARLQLEEDAFRVKKRAKDGAEYTNWTIPVFTRNERGEADIRGRHCTRNYKIRPLHREVTRLVKPRRGEKRLLCSQWIGISMDEVQRVRRNEYAWQVNRYPLLERNMSRLHCIEWMESKGYPRPPRSACVMCPFHSDQEWVHLRDNEPEAFAQAVEFERRFQELSATFDLRPKTPYLHRSLVPLSEVEFFDSSVQMDMWNMECEGMCGL